MSCDLAQAKAHEKALMERYSVADRARYRFDNLMARGVAAQMALLLAVTGVVIVLGTVIVVITSTQHRGVGFWPMLWTSLLHVVDNGNISNDSGSPFYVFVMLLVTVAGLTVLAALFGIVTNGITDRMDALRRGRSRVLERGHTLILGWSPQVFQIISELMVANENQRQASIVVLSDRDKPEMEEEIRLRVPQRGRTRVICRSGDPLDLADLHIANPQAAKSIIVLPPESDDADSVVIKTLLALIHHPERRPQPYHIVAPIRDPKNLEIAEMIGRSEADLVLGQDLIARITVQTCRQSGLSVVYTELLDFDGDEIYFQEEPRLVGQSFGDALFRYDKSALIGLRKANGAILLNPPMVTTIEAGDKVIAISEDDDTVTLSPSSDPDVDTDAIVDIEPEPASPEHMLIFNWTDRTPRILRELEAYVAPGSVATVVGREGRALPESLPGFANLKVETCYGDPTDRETLRRLMPERYDHVIVLGEVDVLGIQEADARTLTTLLHLRRVHDETGAQFTVVSEMADVRNRELAAATRADDFIVSDQLVSLMLTQLSENSDLHPVFDDLFDPDGSEIYLKPVENYLKLGQPLSFYTAVESARRRGEIAIGYRIASQAEDASRQYGVVVNPRKTDKVTFAAGDRLIVVAEQ